MGNLILGIRGLDSYYYIKYFQDMNYNWQVEISKISTDKMAL